MVRPSSKAKTARAISCSAVALLMALALAGCVGGGQATPSSSPPPAGPKPETVENDSTACTRTFIAVLLEKSDAQALLPANFTAADAQRFFATPVETGKGVSLLSVARCTGPRGGLYAEAMAGVFVEPPKVDGFDPAPSNVYELGRAVSGGALRGTLERIGWNLTGNEIVIEYAASPLPTASGNVTDTEASLLPFGTILLEFASQGSPVPDSFTETVRWWRILPNGLAFFEYSFTVQGQLGPGSCSAAAGSPFAQVIGDTSCPRDALFMVSPPFDVMMRMEFRPSLRATA